MTEYEELLIQRRELNEKIKQLKNQAVVVKCAKLDKEHYPSTRPDEYVVAVRSITLVPEDRPRWRSIIRGNSKEEVIAEIPKVMDGLQGLYERLK